MGAVAWFRFISFFFFWAARRSPRFSAFFPLGSHIYSHHHLHHHAIMFLRFCILRSFVDAAIRQSEVERVGRQRACIVELYSI